MLKHRDDFEHVDVAKQHAVDIALVDTLATSGILIARWLGWSPTRASARSSSTRGTSSVVARQWIAKASPATCRRACPRAVGERACRPSRGARHRLPRPQGKRGSSAAGGPDRRRASRTRSQVLSLITMDLRTLEVAADVTSVNWIKSYIRSCYRKIDVDSRSKAVLWGVMHGLGSDPSGAGAHEQSRPDMDVRSMSR